MNGKAFEHTVSELCPCFAHNKSVCTAASCFINSGFLT